MSNKNHLAALAGVAMCLMAGAASASSAWPAKIVGSWSGVSNQSPIVLNVTTQTPGGKCQGISGTIQDVNGGFTGNMTGYYCPGSGAVEFLRYPTGSNVPYQVYSANLSQSPAPRGVGGLMMAGTFSQYALAYGPLGQYSFSLFH